MSYKFYVDSIFYSEGKKNLYGQLQSIPELSFLAHSNRVLILFQLKTVICHAEKLCCVETTQYYFPN